MSDGDARTDLTFNSQLTAVCPSCDRSETFENNQLALAWLSGHIENEHSDELPPFEGVE